MASYTIVTANETDSMLLRGLTIANNALAARGLPPINLNLYVRDLISDFLVHHGRYTVQADADSVRLLYSGSSDALKASVKALLGAS